ncbi:MAG: hypothetical protein HQ596_00255 [Candidatus Saganbacteria bacterium]|nr:hypothetical protein [Candidatus Saganbacteria bacterium]
MLKKILAFSLVFFMLAPLLYADEIEEQEYLNKVYYKNNKLELVARKRRIDVKKNIVQTDIDTITFSFEASSQSSTDISTSTLSQAEIKEIDVWDVYKGGVRKLSDIEFLKIVNDQNALNQALEEENKKAGRRTIGNILIGSGLLVMICGAAVSAGNTVVTSGALTMTAGFFTTAFNLPPNHYIQPDYAQEKIDEYNISLKRKLNLPLNYDD